MRLGAPRSLRDAEKNDPQTDKGSVLSRMLRWISSPLDAEQNDTKTQRESTLKRIHARIFRPNRGTPSADAAQEAPSSVAHSRQVEKEDKPPYSEAESRQASAKLWSIYIGEAERYDKALVESWKADMEGMLIFSGLFSASLTAFLVESYQTLQPDSGTVTGQLLTQISQQLAAPAMNSSLASLDGSQFQPTTSSLVCNTLWFISLTLSITCALLATLVEQWAREFLHRTEKHPSPVRRARVFSFLYFGVRRFGMHIVVDLIPLLLHVAMILFLAGLIAFLVPMNEFLMGLIGAILAVFLAIYAVMTLLPIISSDCPYRTPFSGFVWRLIQDAQKRWLGSTSSGSAVNLNDVMLSTALQKSESRDQRAIAWTLDSLTDDKELLPFIEAIPESIFGPKGFHGKNDHMFISILNGLPNQEPLGRRITGLILSARNMEDNDPMRHRSLVASMKAIWALGMISGRRGALFRHGDGLWFDNDASEAVDVRPGARQNEWPEAAAAAAEWGISYSTVNNLRHHIARLASLAHSPTGPHTELERGLTTLWAHIRRLGPDNPVAEILAPHTALLESWSPSKDTVDIRDVLTSLTKDEIWLRVNVGLLTQLLYAAAAGCEMGKDLPYEYEATCLAIVPNITDPPYTVQMTIPITPKAKSRRFGSNTIWSSIFDPSTVKALPDQISPLDYIMRSLFRLHPVSKLEDVMPVFVLYLAKRNYARAIRCATAYCERYHLGYLLDCMVAMMDSTDENDILRAICAIMANEVELFNFSPRDEQIRNFMMERGIFTSPQFICLSALIKRRKLLHFLDAGPTLLKLNEVGHLHPLDIPWRSVPLMEKLYSQKANQRAYDEWRKMVAHPFLSDGQEDTTNFTDLTVNELVQDIRTRAKRAMVRTLTEFTFACPEAIDQPYLSETMRFMSDVVADRRFGNFRTVESNILVDYAKAWVALVNHLVTDPKNAQIQLTTRHLFLQDHKAQLYYHPVAAPIFKEALLIYLEFLQAEPEQNDSALQKTRIVLDALVSQMTQDSQGENGP
ncbi:hypothetical protein DFH06DRAFT_391672 [Mycena polygramma]|nr:hypothetical protein DFH06DRAFT_391672 [Mycena polygramma]